MKKPKTSLEEFIQEAKREFEEKFVTIDNGADGDGYDVNPPEWNESFRNAGEDVDQIAKITDFLEQKMRESYNLGQKKIRHKT